MIFKASQRGGARELADHLLNREHNEHIEIHSLRGFVADKLKPALEEVHLTSLGTRCEKYLFHVSLNPPPGIDVNLDQFEDALDRIERVLPLAGQSRAVVFHEKKARRHAHSVWSRIGHHTMTAYELGLFKWKLFDVSRQIFIDNGWDLPDGFNARASRQKIKFTARDANNARAYGENPIVLRASLQECWAGSVNRSGFERALEDKEYRLARGVRGSHVIMNAAGGVFPLRAWLGIANCEEKLGSPLDVPGIVGARLLNAKTALARKRQEIDTWRSRLAALEEIRKTMAERHRRERSVLRKQHDERWRSEALIRTNRMPRGLKLLWWVVAGAYDRLRSSNEVEVRNAIRRDRGERQHMIARQLRERGTLQREIEGDQGTDRMAIPKRPRSGSPSPATTAGIGEEEGERKKAGGKGSQGSGGSGGLERRIRKRGFSMGALAPLWQNAAQSFADRPREAKYPNTANLLPRAERQTSDRRRGPERIMTIRRN